MSLLNGFLGGTLIGGAAGLTLLGAGEIMGFAGIINSVLKSPFQTAREQPWKVTFLSSFMLAAYAFLIPNADWAKISSVAAVTSPMAYGLSGLLVRPPQLLSVDRSFDNVVALSYNMTLIHSSSTLSFTTGRPRYQTG